MNDILSDEVLELVRKEQKEWLKACRQNKRMEIQVIESEIKDINQQIHDLEVAEFRRQKPKNLEGGTDDP